MRGTVDRVALITGGSKGIGAATAKRLARDGARVVLTYNTDREGAERVVQDILGSGGQAVAVHADARVEMHQRRAVDTAITTFGRLDILVNNAASFELRALQDIDPDHVGGLVGANVTGVLMAAREAVRAFGSDGGVIVNLSSTVATTDLIVGATVYSATKSAVDILTRTLALELAPLGVRVLAVAPGLVASDGVLNTFPAALLADIAKNSPLGRIGEPEDIADAIALLVSDDARWIVGTTVVVSGGVRLPTVM